MIAPPRLEQSLLLALGWNMMISKRDIQRLPWARIVAFAAVPMLFVLSALLHYLDRHSNALLLIGLCFAAASAVLAAAYLFNVYSSERRREFGFAGVLIFSCVVFAVALPPFSEPDGVHHFFASYWMSDIVLGQSDIGGGGDFPVRSEDYDLHSYICDRAFAADHLYEINYDTYAATVDGVLSERGVSGEYKRMTSYDFTLGSENAPAKLGSVAGITIARLLNLGPFALYYAGRIGSILFYSTLLLLAYRLTLRFKNAVVITALLPMSLNLAASYSYDSGIIALSVLLISAIFRLVESEREVSPVACAGLIVLTVLLAPCKVVYAVSILIALLIPSSKFPNKLFSVAFKAMILVSAAASILLFRSASMTALAGEAASLDYRGFESGHFYSLSYLLAHPLDSTMLFVRTIRDFGSYFLFTMIGSKLGWLQGSIEAPGVLVVSYIIVALLAMQREKTSDDREPVSLRAGSVVVFAIGSFGLLLSLCLGHTFDTELLIMGVQGRYFIPLLPLLLFSIRSSTVSVGRYSHVEFAYTAYGILNLWYLLFIIATATTIMA